MRIEGRRHSNMQITVAKLPNKRDVTRLRRRNLRFHGCVQSVDTVQIIILFKANCEREQRVQPLVAHQHFIVADADDSKAGVPAEIFLVLEVEVFRFNYAKLNCSE